MRREESTQKALPMMPDGASIILNASVVASQGWAQWSVYSATKAVLRSFARTWAADLKDRGIRMNAVSPGVTDTPGLNELLVSSGAGAHPLKALTAGVPLGRPGTPDEIAKAVVFPRLRRQQLCHGDRVVREWRGRTSLRSERRRHHARRKNPCPRGTL